MCVEGKHIWSRPNKQKRQVCIECYEKFDPANYRDADGEALDKQRGL